MKHSFKTLLTLALALVAGNAWGEKITTIAGITSGKQYYIGATTSSTDYYFYVDGSAKTESIKGVAKTDVADAVALKFTAVTGGWTIQFGSGNYLGLKNGKDNGAVQVVEDAVVWTIEEDADKGLLKLHPNDYYLQKNNSGTQFGSYKATQTNVWLEEASNVPAKVLESIAISGTPTQKTYEVGDKFNPAGLVVTGTYSDKTTDNLTEKVEWTITPATFTATTETSVSVTAKVGTISSAAFNVTDLTVNAVLPKITITDAQVTGFTTSYKEYTWTADGVSGKMFAYKTKGMQFNTSKDGYYVYNATPIPGNIRSIKMTTHSDGTEREWKVSVGTSQITSISGDAGTEPTKNVTKSGTTWTITGNNQYFCLEDVSGASNISEIVISYEESTTPVKVLESIAVSGTPTKTSYQEGETFDPAGLVVTGTYSDNSQDVITEDVDWTMENDGTLAKGQTSIIVAASLGSIESAPFEVAGLTVTELVGEKFSLVTDASKLKAGDKLLIVGIGNNAEETYYALKQYETGNNCKTIGIPTPVDGTITVDVDEVDVITLGGEAGAWTLFDGSNYLYAAGGTSDKNNYLKGTSTATNDNAKWTIAIADGKATIKTKDSTVLKHTIRFNQANNLFACYASGQSDVYIYKLAAKTSYDATITSAGFATLYLDFAADIPTGVTAYTAVAAEDAVTLTEIEDVIPAETAVVLEGAAGTYTFEEATTTAAAPANNLVGTLTATDWATVNNGKYIYVLGQKDGVVGFYKLSETGTIKANSAYLALDEDPASGSIIIRKGDATAISLVQENEGEAVIYDLLGRRVSEPMRGIYIVNGKKMFIK